MAGLVWLWQRPAEEPTAPVVYSSMGKKRKAKEARLARLRKDDEMVLAFVRQFVETLHVPR